MRNAADPVQQFLFSSEKQTEEGQPTGFEAFMGYTEDPGVIEPDGLIETFKAGVSSGAEQLAADGNYFRGLFNTVTGDTEEAAESIRKAETQRARSQIPLSSTEKFEEFLEEPTISGFFTQVAKATGQITPSAVSTIGSGFTTGVAALVGKKLIGKTAKDTAERVVKDSITRTAAGTATPVEELLANEAYKTFQRGVLTGAFGSEFVPLAGSNLSEALDSGRPLDEANAYRAAAVALPQATIGVAAEATILKLVGDVAKKRGAKDGLMKALARDISKTAGLGAVAEGGAEFLQDSIAIANRMDMDETYTDEEAKLRLAESTFAGFFGGGGIAAVGGAGGSVISNRAEIADAVSNVDPGKKAASISSKAKEYLDSARQFRNNQKIDEEQYGNTNTGNTTPESRTDINAQLVNITEPSGTKDSVWDAGNEAQHGARPNVVSKITINGTLAFAAFIPGRGTIVSTNEDKVKKVIQEQASDQVLGEAIGYSGPKEGNLVVRVQDKDGNIIHEELTTEANMAKAQEAAEGIKPDGGTVLPAVTAEKALEERKARLDKEKGPIVRPMDIDEDTEAELRGTTIDETAPNTNVETDEQAAERAQRTQEGKEVYPPKADPDQTFDNTESSRQAWQEASGQDIDWTAPFYAAMPESMLRTASNIQNQNPTKLVEIYQTEGGYRVESSSTPDTEKVRFVDQGVEQELSIGTFLERTLQVANRKATAQSNIGETAVTIISKDGKETKALLTDLTNAGRRIVEAREGTGFTGSGRVQSGRDGLMAILGELQLGESQVQLNGKNLLDMNSRELAQIGRNVKASGGKNQQGDSLGFLLGPNRGGQGISKARAEAIRRKLEIFEAELAQNSSRNRAFTNRAPVEVGTNQRREAIEAEKAEFLEQEGLAPETNLANLDLFLNLNDNTSPAFNDSAENREGISDTSQITEESLSDLPLTQHNIELGPADTTRNQNTGKGGNNRTSNRFRQATFPFGSLGNLATTVINRAVHALRLKKPVAVIGVKEYLANPAKLAEMFDDKVVAQRVEEIINELINNPNARGRYVGFGNAHFILVDNRVGNQLENTYVAAHELGHALFNEEMDFSLNNKMLYARLFKAFEKARAKEGSPKAYNDSNPHAFEEWYADQVAIWAQALYVEQKKNAKNFVERHFQQVVERLRNMFKAMSATMKRRFGKEAKSETFQQYMDEVIAVSKRNRFASRNESAARVASPTMQTKVIVRAIEDTVPVSEKYQRKVNSIMRAISEVLAAPNGRRVTKWVLAEDNIIRAISPKIADMFYIRSGKKGLGFLQNKRNARNEMLGKLKKIIGTDWDKPEIEAALIEASTDKPTSELTGKALGIRKFLEELYDDYISKVPGNDVARRKDYFPLAFDLENIHQNPQKLIDVIKKYSPDEESATIVNTVNGLIALHAHILADGDITVDGTNPSKLVEKARQLTDKVPPQEIREFLLPPGETLVRYIRHVTIRTEFNRATKIDPENSILERELNKLSPEDRNEVTAVIERYLGFTRNPMNPKLAMVSGYAQLFNWVTLLPMVTISSITELGGAVVASKDFEGFSHASKAILYAIQNREEAVAIGEEMGVNIDTALANLGLTDADSEFLDAGVRKLSDKFFKVIGLDFYTRFTREVAVLTGINFIEAHALHAKNGTNPHSLRYLDQHGLTPDQVFMWKDQQPVGKNYNFASDEGIAVKAAIQRFVSNAMLQPNAAERPAWANDPRYAIFWQLKSFLYSFGKVMIGGTMREAKVRFEGADTTMDKLSGVALQAALAGVAFMPLAMLALEIKELTKYLLAMVLPGVEASGKYFRSDRMEYGEYLVEIFDRAGLAGPMSIIGMASKTREWGQTGVGPILGPTAGFLIDDLALGIARGEALDLLPERVIPGFNIVM